MTRRATFSSRTVDLLVTVTSTFVRALTRTVGLRNDTTTLSGLFDGG
jgi:hypothetical protein